jgi:hypothetical protein
VQWSEADQFPDWWPKAAVRSAFTFVHRGPDVSMLPLPKWTWQERDFEAAGRLAEESTVPTAVYYPFDSWDDPPRGWQGPLHWAEPLRRYVLLADVVAGPTLPVSGGPPDVVPLPYPPLVRRRASPPDLASSAIDVHFAGYFREPGWAAPPADTRDRRYRGHLVGQLRDGLPDRRLRIRRTQYWGDDAQANLRRRYVREIDRSAIVLAPAGYGYLTFRHADAWARGRAALSEPVHRRLRVPEPERWESGDVCLTYDPCREDIVEVVERALDDPARLSAIAASGWDYGRRWTDPAAQVACLADALRARLGRERG